MHSATLQLKSLFDLLLFRPTPVAQNPSVAHWCQRQRIGFLVGVSKDVFDCSPIICSTESHNFSRDDGVLAIGGECYVW